MANSIFWKGAAVAAIAAVVYVGQGLNKQSRGPEFPLAKKALAAEVQAPQIPADAAAPKREVVPISGMLGRVERLSIDGGWLVFSWERLTSTRNGEAVSSGLTFVPDKDHAWKVGK